MYTMKWGRFASIPILAVLLLMGFVYYITLFVLIQESVGLRSPAGKKSAAVFSCFAFYCLFCFLVCVVTEPGQVPSYYVPDVEDRDNSGRGSGKNAMYSRKCESCSRYKPPRCHHCRVCRRCILRMDHHCRWVNNCIGHWNYKAFFTLVLFATLGSGYSSVVFITCAHEKGWHFQGSRASNFLHVCSGVMLLGLSIVLATFLGWHIYLIARNMTTIEYHEGVRARWLARKSGQSYSHPFDLGFYRNLTSVLGPNILLWFWPTAVNHLRDGANFPLASRDD